MRSRPRWCASTASGAACATMAARCAIWRRSITLMLESDIGGEDPMPLVERLAGLQFGQTYLSTQEQAWLIMAAKSVAAARSSAITVSLNGVPQAPRDTPLNLKPSGEDLSAGLKVANAGDGSLWAVTTIMGSPEKPQPPVADGFTLTRRFYTLDRPGGADRQGQADRHAGGRAGRQYGYLCRAPGLGGRSVAGRVRGGECASRRCPIGVATDLARRS